MNNTITYNGFIGSVNYSQEDSVFYGKIEGINALVNFEGESVEELQNSFRSAVDDYVALCREKGIEPRKKYTGSFNVRVSPDVHMRLATLAQKRRTSINKVVKSALEKFLGGIAL